MALTLLAVLGICATLCFVQAARIQKRWAVDGVMFGRPRFSAMWFWLLAGSICGVGVFALLMGIVNPPPASLGRP